jgi:pyruvate/2-oxoglutarate/acetoin dehydrogenase E1 component
MSTHKIRELSYAQAIYEAVFQEMQADENVIVVGQGVDDCRGLHGTTKDLHKVFGAERCFDTPIAEEGMTGIAIGAAMAGLRPIHVHQRMDFILLCMSQLVNSAAKMHYMYEGQSSVPMVVRASIGRSWGQGAQHSQALHSMFAHVPGLKVVMPSTPYDAKGLMTRAIRDNNPVVYIEHRMLYQFKGHVPEEQYEVEFGKARVLSRGDDITLLGVSHMVAECSRAGELLKAKGLSSEIIDPICLTPLDIDTISQSAERTGHLLIVDNGWTNYGLSAEVIAQLMDRYNGRIPFVVKRLGFASSPCPTTRELENHYYPSPQSIASSAYEMVKGKTDWNPPPVISREVQEFRGPF